MPLWETRIWSSSEAWGSLFVKSLFADTAQRHFCIWVGLCFPTSLKEFWPSLLDKNSTKSLYFLVIIFQSFTFLHRLPAGLKSGEYMTLMQFYFINLVVNFDVFVLMEGMILVCDFMAHFIVFWSLNPVKSFFASRKPPQTVMFL